MNRKTSFSTVIALFLCANASAQGSVTSPRGFDNVEGNSAANALGGYPGGRYMTFDGEQSGHAMSIKGVAYRADNRVYAASHGMGRKWTNVQVRISECDMSSLNSTFSSNPSTPQSLVFDTAVSWPTITGKPQQFPSNWILDFPFSSSWSYSGKNGICLEYSFTGGTLANNAAWASTTKSSYYKDGVNGSTYAYQTSTPLGLSGSNKGCNDRGLTHLYGASVSSSCYFYSNTYSNKSYRGRLTFTQNGSYFGASTPVATLIGFRSVWAGWQFPGVHCNKVHIDMTLPTVLFTQFSQSSGRLPGLSPTGQYGVPADASLSGAEIVSQAGWLDSVTKGLLFSSAARLVIPRKPQSYIHSMLYNTNNKAATGYGPYASSQYSPVVRYTK